MTPDQQRIGALADAMGAMAFLTEPGGRMVWHNRQFEVQTGFTAADFQFENPDNPFIHPDDLPRVGAFLAAFAAGNDAVSETIENRFTDRWGTVLTYRSVVLRTEWQGQMAFMVVATKAQEHLAAEQAVRISEERYRRLVERANDGIVKLAADGRVLFANGRFQELLGLDAVSLAKVRFVDLVHPEDRPRLDNALADVPDHGLRVELRLAGAEASTLRLDIDLVPLRDESGLQAVLRDVTQQRALEARTQEQQKLESLGLLAGNVAHDFNNVLTGILGNLSLARTYASSGTDLDELLGEAEAATEQAGSLAHMLLAYAGRAPARRGRLDLTTLLGDARPLLDAAAGHHARLVLAPGNAPLWVEADPAQLTQVVLNLVTNACEASPAGATVEVSVARAPDDLPTTEWVVVPGSAGHWACLRVRDAGQGIDADVRKRMFDPFYSTKNESRGLGLSSALGIVRSHQGGLRVSSRRGSGTDVEVYLPLAESKTPAASPRRVRRVLVVDDEPSIRKLVIRTLQRAGLVAVEASNGAEALGALATGAFDLVVLDYNMPGQSGGEVLRTLRPTHPELPVLCISGFASQAQWGDEAGPSTYIAKPFLPRQLLAEVQRMLGD